MTDGEKIYYKIRKIVEQKLGRDLSIVEEIYVNFTPKRQYCATMTPHNILYMLETLYLHGKTKICLKVKRINPIPIIYSMRNILGNFHLFYIPIDKFIQIKVIITLVED